MWMLPYFLNCRTVFHGMALSSLTISLVMTLIVHVRFWHALGGPEGVPAPLTAHWVRPRGVGGRGGNTGFLTNPSDAAAARMRVHF